ncbi:hypothetical protein GCM10027280_35680 [Micromonospora polyrhachis]|uniref:cytochrome-c oxidase n=1 Tax=Micromonospora polyrhachis TaxID=1282883 RepID=A0A7W7SQ13_9ACTN|nr:cytochrome c oxidase subunit I [Micromonospora polyrhachis]MBB4958829.1 cytochrome c oxidase subunit I+III [Micromonospora polyrhachis]
MVDTVEASHADRFTRTWDNPPGLKGFFTQVNHKSVGIRYMLTAFVLFLVGGVEALVMRVQLARPESDVLDPQSYNELFTMHGTTMMFLFAIPFLEGLATYLLPLHLGARDMPFPRYNVFNYWCYLFGGLILYSSFLVAMVPDAGWYAYVPLSGPDFAGKAMDFWLFGLTLAELAAVGAAIEISVAVLKMRAPGMTLNRMPIFAWAMLAVAFLIIVAFIPLIVASVLLELDRVVGSAFFDPVRGGDPLLWQHLFWIFGHPEVYVMFLPGSAIVSHVIPVYCRRPLVAYPLVVLAIVVTAVMSLGLWVHHMYTVGLPPLTLSFFTAASMTITLASGLQVFAWIATLLAGRPRFSVPMLYSLGFLVTFVAGGITGVMVASVPFDGQVHDTYFVVAHFHYVVLGGMLFPVFAGLYHWWPKITGRLLDDRLGHVSFWLVFVGFHVTFFPMHLTGLWGMPRRVYTYERELGIGTVNLISTVGAFVLASGVVVLTVAFAWSLVRGRRAPADPWRGDTLEWATASPPPPENFPDIPVVTSRQPNWDSPPPDELHAPVRQAFLRRPADFRASPLTTALWAEPEGAARLATSTGWPLVPAVGLAVIAVGMLVQWWPVPALGIAVVLAGLVGWALRNEAEHTDQQAVPLTGQFPFEAPGSRSITWWGAAGAAMVGVVAVVTLAFSALYLQVNAVAWPGDGRLDRPLSALGVTVALVLATAATRWGARRRRTDGPGPGDPHERSAHVTAALVALAAGTVALAVTLAIWFGSDIRPVRHAYDSIAVTLLGAQTLIVLVGVASSAVALLGRWRHVRDSRPANLLQGAALIWGAALFTWLVTWATTDLLPVLVG